MKRLHRIFFFLTILLLPTQLGKHFWPEWTLVLGRRIDYLSPTFFLTDVTLFFTCFFFLLHDKFREVKKMFAKRIILFASLGFLIFSIINIIFSTTPQVALFSWIKIYECLFLIWYIVKTNPSVSMIIFFLFLSSFYSSLIAIAQFFLKHSIGGPLWFLGERTFSVSTPGIARTFIDFSSIPFFTSNTILRPYATFPHPNTLGGFLAVVLPFIFFYKKKIIQSKFFPLHVFLSPTLIFYFIFFISFFALLLTFSKTALVAFSVAILWMAVKKYWKPMPAGPLRRTEASRQDRLFLVGIILVTLLFLFSYIKISATTTIDESIENRISLQASAAQIFRTSPVIGVGLNNFLIHLPDATRVRKVYFLQPVHSVYMLLLTEVGIVGVAAFLFCFVKIASLAYKKRKEKRIQVLLIALIELFFLGLFDHYLLTSQQGRLLSSLFVGLLILSLIRKEKSVSV